MRDADYFHPGTPTLPYIQPFRLLPYRKGLSLRVVVFDEIFKNDSSAMCIEFPFIDVNDKVSIAKYRWVNDGMYKLDRRSIRYMKRVRVSDV